MSPVQKEKKNQNDEMNASQKLVANTYTQKEEKKARQDPLPVTETPTKQGRMNTQIHYNW